MNRQPKVFWTTVIIVVALPAITLLLDYLNVPTRLGINVDNLNMDVHAIVINAVVTVSLFLGAYYLIDRWEAQKHQNQESTAKMLLKTTYRLCRDYATDLGNPSTLDSVVQMKNGGAEQEKLLFAKYEEMPFDYDSSLMKYFSDGILSSDELRIYLRVKGLFYIYVNFAVSFYGSKEKEKTINDIKEYLLGTVDDAICRLEH